MNQPGKGKYRIDMEKICLEEGLINGKFFCTAEYFYRLGLRLHDLASRFELTFPKKLRFEVEWFADRTSENDWIVSFGELLGSDKNGLTLYHRRPPFDYLALLEGLILQYVEECISSQDTDADACVNQVSMFEFTAKSTGID